MVLIYIQYPENNSPEGTWIWVSRVPSVGEEIEDDTGCFVVKRVRYHNLGAKDFEQAKLFSTYKALATCELAFPDD